MEMSSSLHLVTVYMVLGWDYLTRVLSTGMKRNQSRIGRKPERAGRMKSVSGTTGGRPPTIRSDHVNKNVFVAGNVNLGQHPSRLSCEPRGIKCALKAKPSGVPSLFVQNLVDPKTIRACGTPTRSLAYRMYLFF